MKPSRSSAVHSPRLGGEGLATECTALDFSLKGITVSSKSQIEKMRLAAQALEAPDVAPFVELHLLIERCADPALRESAHKAFLRSPYRSVYVEAAWYMITLGLLKK